MPLIEPYEHRCTIRSGDMEGSTWCATVDAYDVEYANLCQNCGEPLATPEQIIAHIYGELLKETSS